MRRPLVKPSRLSAGSKVHLVSPASTPTAQALDQTVRYLESLDLDVVLGEHVLDRHGYLAGTDAARITDLNRALRDPAAAAVVATRGGKGGANESFVFGTFECGLHYGQQAIDDALAGKLTV